MTLAHLALLPLSFSLSLPLRAAGPDPASLVAGLASPRPAEREEAAGLLEELGRPALPALLKARDADPDDPDRRRLVAQLIDLIERQRLLRPTRVALDFEDRTLAEVAEALRERTGFLVEVGPDVKPATRRGTLRAAKPVPFWEAIDLLGASYGVRHNPGLPFKPERREPVVPLVASEGPPPPADYAGPFRVNLIRVGRSREVSPARPPATLKARVVERFSADLQVFAEPGLFVAPNGPLVLSEAVDDRGHDLRPAPPGTYNRAKPHSQLFDQSDLSVLEYPVALRLPDAPGVRVKRLRGHIPVTVIARTDGPVVVPLAGAPGKTFSAGGLSLTVSGVGREGENTKIGLKIKGEPPDPLFASRSQPAPPGDYRPPYRLEDRLQVLDDRRRVLVWNYGQARPGPGGEIEVAVNVYDGRDRLGPPAELRYHGLVGAAAEVVFDFADLPMP